MGALAIPQKMKLNSANRTLCARIGIKLNGVPRFDVVEYEAGEAGYVITSQGDRFVGSVEPYWR